MRFGGIYYYLTVIRDFEYMMSAFCITMHMTFSNILVQPNWRDHIQHNLLTIFYSFIIHHIYFPETKEFYLQILFGLVLIQPIFLLLVAVVEKTAKLNWIQIDSLQKLSKNLEKIIEEVPIQIYIVNNN